MLRKLPIVGVLGQGARIPPERARLAREVGAMVARLGAHLLTGGGYGVMEAAAQGFTAIDPRAGLSIGIVPRAADGAFDTPNRDLDGRPYPNAYIEIAIMTPLPPRVADWHSEPGRNHINILTTDANIVLPGNVGTRNELDMAAHYRDEAKRARNDRRTVLVGPPGEFSQEHRELFVHASSVAEAERHIRRVLAARGFPISAGAQSEHAAP
jgi:uncharacterized protein (TIGR00725 family)